MSLQRLIVFATQTEAAATLKTFQARKDLKDSQLYHSDIGSIIIPGIGILAAAQAICRYAHLTSEVWNFGAAGALSDLFALEQLVQIASVHRNPLVPDYVDERSQLFQKEVYPPLVIHAEGRHLVSGDYPIHDHTARQNLAKTSDLIDMEGYGVAHAARYCNLPCQISKVVTDWAQPGGTELIQQKLAIASEIIADHLKSKSKLS